MSLFHGLGPGIVPATVPAALAALGYTPDEIADLSDGG